MAARAPEIATASAAFAETADAIVRGAAVVRQLRTKARRLRRAAAQADVDLAIARLALRALKRQRTRQARRASRPATPGGGQ